MIRASRGSVHSCASCKNSYDDTLEDLRGEKIPLLQVLSLSHRLTGMRKQSVTSWERGTHSAAFSRLVAADEGDEVDLGRARELGRQRLEALRETTEASLKIISDGTPLLPRPIHSQRHPQAHAMRAENRRIRFQARVGANPRTFWYSGPHGMDSGICPVTLALWRTDRTDVRTG